jgi:4-hydroxythreonine-4-phosphate dehydrogenase
MGDPAGIGPEIIAKVVSSGIVADCGRVICVGDAETLRHAVSVIGANLEIRTIDRIAEYRLADGVLEVLDPHNIPPDSIRPGFVQAAAGRAAYEYVVRAIDMALSGEVSAMITAPINKEALHLAGHHYDGHTEILAQRTRSKDVTMLLASGSFRVAHVSTHVSLRKAVRRCRSQRILSVIRLTHQGLQMMGVGEPRLAVAGLNPHSGEGGFFGIEETTEIQPAIDAAIREGFRVYGNPVPADSVFVRMQEAREFDAVIAQYHDQGHIPAKLVDFWGSVNITLGLPIIRTSVDHGTAFDIAGQGKANCDSLVNAIRCASQMCSWHTAAGGAAPPSHDPLPRGARRGFRPGGET